MVYERFLSLRKATRNLHNVQLRHYNQTIEQDPETPGFWEKWTALFKSWGFQPGDLIVSSETYGNKLAELLGGKHMVYDPYREVTPVKATDTREHLYRDFDHLLPEFQDRVRLTVTVFGAESTGKTTLAHELANRLNGHYLMEWARPYLEVVHNEITQESMTDIWHGQRALQDTGRFLPDKPLVVQDTDLFSTVGYWTFWSPETMPEQMVRDADRRASDLYLITQSNIPFEQDPLRYGGDKREASDQFWINLCQQYNLPYVVLTSDEPHGRFVEAVNAIDDAWQDLNGDLINYEREANA